MTPTVKPPTVTVSLAKVLRKVIHANWSAFPPNHCAAQNAYDEDEDDAIRKGKVPPFPLARIWELLLK